jgi:hypothetical protein
MPIPRLRPRPLAVALAASLAALAPSLASAQSLIQLYDAAHAYDASYLAARASTSRRPYRVDQTRALLRPNVALGANAGELKAYLDNSPNPTNSSYGVHDHRPAADRQPVEPHPIAQSERSLVSSLADLDAAEQDLMLRVSQAYFDVLGAQDTLATTRASKAAIAEQLASAKRNFEVGTATITDTREAQARFDLATAQEIAADNDLVTKRIALDQLVGQSNVAPKQLAVPVVLPLPKTGVEEYVSRAAEEHPSVRRALGRLRGAPSSRPRRRATSGCRRSTRSPRSATAAASTSRALRPDHEHRPAAQHAALHRRRDPEPDQGDAGARGARAQRPRGGAPRRHPDDPPGLLHAAVGRGAGEGAGGGRGLEPARARGDAGRLPGRHPRSTSMSSMPRASCTRRGATWPGRATTCCWRRCACGRPSGS